MAGIRCGDRICCGDSIAPGQDRAGAEAGQEEAVEPEHEPQAQPRPQPDLGPEESRLRPHHRAGEGDSCMSLLRIA